MEGVETMDDRALMKYLSAFCMGDGGVYPVRKGSKQCYFVGGHIEKNADYVEWKKSILENITKVRVKRIEKEGHQVFLRIETRSHPVFQQIRQRLYRGTYRGVDSHFLKLLDWEMLAILFQDDGHARDRSHVKRNPEITLGLCRLSEGDFELLRKRIEKILNINFNISGSPSSRVLRLRNKHGPTFMKNVEPFIFPSMKYKFINPDVWLARGNNGQGDIVRTIQ